MQAATTKQGGKQHGYAGIYREWLEHGKGTKAGEVIPHADRMYVVYNWALLNHHPFGFSRGTGGVNHIRQVFRSLSALDCLSALCPHLAPFRIQTQYPYPLALHRSPLLLRTQ